MRVVMGTPEGRATMLRLCVNCDPPRQIAQTDPLALAQAVGLRDFGKVLGEQIREWCPDQWALALRESDDRD